jgi:hypothetical protein
MPVPILAAEPPAPCILEIPVYSPTADRLPFKITRVIPTSVNGDEKFDLLSHKIDGITATAKGDRVFFSSKKIIGGALEVTLEGPGKARLATKLIMTGCRVRRELVLGSSDLGFDVSGVDVRARLAGCNFKGDWWVRAMPMFSNTEKAGVSEGYVDVDGSIFLALGGLGERTILVIGKGKQPVKSIALDITVGKRHDFGSVDLSGLCPKEQ